MLTFAVFLSRWAEAEPVSRIPLSIEPRNNNAVISWSYPSRGFALELSANLTNWQNAGMSVSNNGRWEFSAPATSLSRYFRLKNHVEHFGFWPGSIAPQGSILEQNGYVNFIYLQGGFTPLVADQAVAAGMKLLLP